MHVWRVWICRVVQDFLHSKPRTSQELAGVGNQSTLLNLYDATWLSKAGFPLNALACLQEGAIAAGFANDIIVSTVTVSAHSRSGNSRPSPTSLRVYPRNALLGASQPPSSFSPLSSLHLEALFMDPHTHITADFVSCSQAVIQPASSIAAGWEWPGSSCTVGA